jgi:hypothetical protein
MFSFPLLYKGDNQPLIGDLPIQSARTYHTVSFQYNRFVTAIHNVGQTLDRMAPADRAAAQGETAALHVLTLRGMTSHTLSAAIIAAARARQSPKVENQIAVSLNDSDEDVQIKAIQALAATRKEDNHRDALAKLANSSPSQVVRRLAQDVLDHKDYTCTTLLGQAVHPCDH